MSWIAKSLVVFGDTAEGDLRDGLEVSGQQGPHVENAVEGAIDAAVALIRSGTVGHPGHHFRVSLSGHANEGHKPDPQWTNDFININVQQV